MQVNQIMTRFLPWIVVGWVFLMLLSLYCGWFDSFFWAAQHAHVQGIDYFALPKSFINLLEHRSAYDTWQGSVFGPYATWYLAHPVFSVLIMPAFAYLPPWLSYVAFVLFSLAMMIYCGKLYAKYAPEHDKAAYYALFLLAFPVYWMLYVGNMHAPLVLSLALILLGLYELVYTPQSSKYALRKLLYGLLISFFTKPVVLLLLPALLIVPKTRKTTLIALVIYAIGSILMLSVSWFNPESIGWAKRMSVMFDIPFIKENMNIYKNQFVLNEYMKDNIIHWLNLIAQSGYRYNHIENFSFPVFLDSILEKQLPGSIYFAPILLCQLFALCLFIVENDESRLKLLLWLTMLSSTSYFLTYNTVWEYQYASMLPVVAMLYRLRKTDFIPKTHMNILLVSGLFYYLPSFYCLLDQTKMDASFIAMIRVSRSVATVILFSLISVGLFRHFIKEFRAFSWLEFIGQKNA